MGKRKIRCLISKVGLDYHDRGSLLIAKSLADAGMEVIYLDAGQTPVGIVNTAIQEDVDMLGVSCMTAAHMENMGKIMNLLREKKGKDILVLLGGIVPKEDIPKLKQMGVAEVFGPASLLNEIVDYIQQQINM